MLKVLSGPVAGCCTKSEEEMLRCLDSLPTGSFCMHLASRPRWLGQSGKAGLRELWSVEFGGLATAAKNKSGATARAAAVSPAL